MHNVWLWIPVKTRNTDNIWLAEKHILTQIYLPHEEIDHTYFRRLSILKLSMIEVITFYDNGTPSAI